jgi:hypothetical protein
MASRALNVIRALYGAELRVEHGNSFWRRLGIGKGHRRIASRNSAIELYGIQKPFISYKYVAFIVVMLFLAVHAILSIYYYNILTTAEQTVIMRLANIDALLDRRRNISTNFARTVRDYAIHERSLFEHVSNTRASFHPSKTDEQIGSDSLAATTTDPGPAPLVQGNAPSGALPHALGGEAMKGTLPSKPTIDGLLSLADQMLSGKMPVDKQLSGMLALAEQYPTLQLSQNFRQFMDALVETEKDLFAARIKYSESINSYATMLRVFPNNVYGRLYHFKTYRYFEADKDAKRFRPVDY